MRGAHGLNVLNCLNDYFSYCCPPYIFTRERLDGFDLITVQFAELTPVPFYVSEISGRDPVHLWREIKNPHAASDEGFQTKNYRNRSVSVHPDLKKILIWWRDTRSTRVRLHKSDKSEYVVTYKGERVASVERTLRSAYKKAGLRAERPFHTLRHSFGAFLAMAGVSLYEIAKLMGHTFEQVTQLYAHLQPEHLHKQVGKIPPIAIKPPPRD